MATDAGILALFVGWGGGGERGFLGFLKISPLFKKIEKKLNKILK
jgi:hypothetical protein